LQIGFLKQCKLFKQFWRLFTIHETLTVGFKSPNYRFKFNKNTGD